MTRKQYVADLQQAVALHGVDFIHDVYAGEDDGQFQFLFVHSSLDEPVSITAGVTDLSDYPDQHDYFIFAADETPRELAEVLSTGLPSTNRKTVAQLLVIVSNALCKHVSPDAVDGAMPDLQADESSDLEEGEEDDGDDFDAYSEPDYEYGTGLDPPTSIGVGADGNLRAETYSEISAASRNRIRADLRAAKIAGFKVGCLRGLLEGHSCFVSLSIRIAKLGIGEAAMQAWQVEPSDYLILLMSYPSYKHVGQLLRSGTDRKHTAPVMRVGLSKRYKPTLDQALAAFSLGARSTSTEVDDHDLQNSNGFQATFISKSLENLLNDQLISILEFREVGMSRSGAEAFYTDNRGATKGRSRAVADKYFLPEEPNDAYPAIVNADAWSLANSFSLSFPLLAMQTVLRHFVRCTEFCVVCHKKLDTETEAIKPYVCDDGLCLYQYVTMGFGPSFEHEIIAQPYTVDLLISFAYNQTAAGKLKDFPHGLAMSIPRSFEKEVEPLPVDHHNRLVAPPTTPAPEHADGAKIAVKYDRRQGEILFPNVDGKCPVRHGDWIVVHQEDVQSDGPFHCRVIDICYPSVRVGPYINLAKARQAGGDTAQPEQPTISDHAVDWHPASIEKYDVDFDGLSDNSKRVAILNLLECLPSVTEMRNYLTGQRSQDLGAWSNRIPPAALGVLRWVIASNRACILQVYDMDSVTGRPVPKEDRVYGMKGWMQFRFAMGAPDKERRFRKEVHETASRLKLEGPPTIFAFHGSGLYNWHSIIREGLNYDEVVNGRACGHGVYHSLQLTTSLGYSHRGYGCTTGRMTWPRSTLQIHTAMALNEIVNAPVEFRSSNPHLVVQHVDWIQTRYLFVKCAGESVTGLGDQMPAVARRQDASMAPVNESGIRLVIPACSATTGKRRAIVVNTPKKNKKAKGKGYSDHVNVDGEDEVHFGDDSFSDATDSEDLDILFDEEVNLAKSIKEMPPQTDFVPGELKHHDLPKMPLPDYANVTATTRLSRDFRAPLKVQNATPLHELGWYIDTSTFDSPYQWIVELHSFHTFEDKGAKIPLVDDMKKAGVRSIVLEMRFPGSYPMSPPFVRVIKPRFLAFMQGGGGHVTAGGALCMELLTNSGWSAVSSIDSVLLQVRLAIASTDPKPARLESSQPDKQGVYGSAEAMEAYKRACRAHGWDIPPGFDKMFQSNGES